MSLALLIATATVAQYDPSTPVEMYVAPVLAPARVIGMGGAAQALAVGSGGILLNPAAIASRYDYNGNTWFDWDFSFDALASSGNVDIENSGRSDNGERVALLDASLGFNFGRLGLGAAFDITNVRTCPPGVASCDDATSLQITTVIGMLALAYNFLDGEVVTGASLILPGASFRVSGEDNQPTYNGTALALGVIVRPNGHPFRYGSTLRFKTIGERDNKGDGATVGGRLIPDTLESPWQLSTGVAYGFGDRPMNLRNSFGDPRLVGDALTQRRYIVFAADLVLIGKSRGAIGRGAWLAQDDQRAGEKINASIRLGAESEFWENRMVGRVGSYYEPSRFSGEHGRLHGTVGFDLRLFQLIWMWKMTAALDVARQYQNLSLSVGFWH